MGYERAVTDNTPPLSGAGGGAFTFVRDAWRAFQFARELRAGTSNFKSPSTSLLEALLGGPTKSGASVNENTAFNVSAIRACVNLRANLLAMLPVKVYQRTELGPKEQRDHPLARLLRGRVSGGQTRFKWIHASQVCFDIGGNAYSRVFRNTFAEIERIQWLKPVKVTPLINESTGATGFRLSGDTGRRELAQWEMLHVSNLSTDGTTGRAPLSDLREVVGLALTAEEFTGRTFNNGNRKPGVLVGGQGMTKAKADEFLAFWMQHYAGAANAGKSPLLFGGMEWKDAGFSNADAELLGMRKFSIEEIARVYHLPLHLIGSTDKATTWGSGIEQLNQGLVDYTLQPICTNWEAEMNTTLLTEREQEEGFYLKFNVDALLRGSPETRAKVYQMLRGIAAIDVNQIRRSEDWPIYDRPDGVFDDPRLPMNNQGGGNPIPAKLPAGADNQD
jgi:HK97 family phage portal protein